MAFDSGSNKLTRPKVLVDLLGYRNASRSGFKGAHIVGDTYWELR